MTDDWQVCGLRENEITNNILEPEQNGSHFVETFPNLIFNENSYVFIKNFH